MVFITLYHIRKCMHTLDHKFCEIEAKLFFQFLSWQQADVNFPKNHQQ